MRCGTTPNRPRVRRAFAKALNQTGDAALEIETQIARTFSMRRDFVRANSMLDAVAARTSATPRRACVSATCWSVAHAQLIRSVRRRSRCFRMPFSGAARNEVLLAIDAAHMFGFSKNLDEAMSWNQVAMRLALASELPRAIRWRASIITTWARLSGIAAIWTLLPDTSTRR